jgi:Arc/MetJ-type ribon-helix-helix transcriptional regulator
LDLSVIDKLTGKNGIYPSRSELIRVAVRSYLIKEMAMIEAFQNAQQTDKTGLDLRNYNTLHENTNIFQSSQQ